MKKISYFIFHISYFIFHISISFAQSIRTEYWDNGQKKSEGNVVNGIRDGAWRMWFDNGHIAQQGFYKQGQIDGTWTSYFMNGKVDKISVWENKKIKKWETFYTNEKKEFLMEFGEGLSDTNFLFIQRIINEIDKAKLKFMISTQMEGLVKDTELQKYLSKQHNQMLEKQYKEYAKTPQSKEKFLEIADWMKVTLIGNVLKKNEKEGVVFYYNYTGDLIQEAHYINHSEEKRYINQYRKHKLITQYNYVNENLVFKCEWTNKKQTNFKVTGYYIVGAVEYTGQFKQNKKSGTWKYFDLDGNLKKEVGYKNGVLKSEKIF